MTDCKIDFAAMPWVEAAAGARFKVFKHEEKQIRLLEFTKSLRAKRSNQEPDWCRKGHIGYILEGELEVEFADVAWASCPCTKEPSTGKMPVGRLVTFKAGDGVFIPAGETHQHKARAVTEVARLVLVEEF